MSTDNKQIVKEMYAAAGRGEMDKFLDHLAEEVSWNAPGAAPFSGRRHGRAQVREFFEEVDRTLQMDQFDADEFIAEGDRVVVLGRERATVKETGSRFEQSWAHVFRLRDGKVTEALVLVDTHAVASAFGESMKERQALGGPLGVTHEAYSGRTRE